MDQRFACNLSGLCEPSGTGIYLSHADCLAHCQPSPLTSHEREAIFLSISYDPEQAFSLAPSDLVLYLKREYGISTSIALANTLYLSLYTNNYLSLYLLRQRDYLASRLKRKPPRRLDQLDDLLLLLLARRADGLLMINWDGFRMTVSMGLAGLLGVMSWEEVDDDIDGVLSRVYELVDELLVDVFGVESQPVGEGEDVPLEMYDYLTYLKERYARER